MEIIMSGLDHLHEVENVIIRMAIMLCDSIGIFVLLTTVIKSAINYFRRDRHIKIMLARGLALALEFKLAAEVLRTITVREINELIILGSIIMLRGAITLLIHWEIKTEKADEEQEAKLEKENVKTSGSLKP